MKKTMKQFMNRNISYIDFFEEIKQEFRSNFPEIKEFKINVELNEDKMVVNFDFSMTGKQLMISSILAVIKNKYEDVKISCGSMRSLEDFVEVNVKFEIFLYNLN
jgi:hypothetical protein